MATILRLDASARPEGSHTRALGDFFERQWLAAQPDDRVIRRDLAADPLPHIPQETVEGFFTTGPELPPRLREATRLSDQLIAELKAADVLLVTSPAYNFTVPSTLKAWIDHVVRPGHTFEYTDQGVNGLAGGRHAFVICAYGSSGYLDGGPLASHDFLGPYLSVVLNFIGITEVCRIAVESTIADEATVDAGTRAAQRAIHEAVRTTSARAG